MKSIDISMLDKESKEIIRKMCELAKENQYLRNVIKELTKLI